MLRQNGASKNGINTGENETEIYHSKSYIVNSSNNLSNKSLSWLCGSKYCLILVAALNLLNIN